MATKKASKKSTNKAVKKSSTKKSTRKKYGSSAAKQVKTEMHEMKKGKLKSDRSGKKVTSRKQAIAIGLSEARKKGAKVPKKKMMESNYWNPTTEERRTSSTGISLSKRIGEITLSTVLSNAEIAEDHVYPLWTFSEEGIPLQSTLRNCLSSMTEHFIQVGSDIIYG